MEATNASAAVEAVQSGELSYCKYLSANDTKLTGGHQSGYLIGRHGWPLLFPDMPERTPDAERTVRIRWNGELSTDSRFKYYQSKRELRLTRFGIGFPYLDSAYCGALFVLVRRSHEDYDAYVLNTDSDIDEFLDTLSLSPQDINHLVYPASVSQESSRKMLMRQIAEKKETFPDSASVSALARDLWLLQNQKPDIGRADPDKAIVEWTDWEYDLFREFEHACYGERLREGFASVNEFIDIANQVLNRRKSRAGKGIEHHLSAVFDANRIAYTPQARTEENKRPDFLFPSQHAYHDAAFPTEGLTVLAAKRTCKDRWRQIVTEADRLRDHWKYLFTLQQGNSPAQLRQMQAERVRLVVPSAYVQMYPPEFRNELLTLKQFVDLVQHRELLFHGRYERGI